MFYTYEHYEYGKTLIVQIEPEVVGDLNMSASGPELEVEKLLLDGKDILTSNSRLTKWIAQACKQAIEEDYEWQCEMARLDGWRYDTVYGDPDGEWKAPKQQQEYEHDHQKLEDAR